MDEQTKIQLSKAKRLIQHQEYRQALLILRSVDHPTAQQWTKKLRRRIQKTQHPENGLSATQKKQKKKNSQKKRKFKKVPSHGVSNQERNRALLVGTAVMVILLAAYPIVMFLLFSSAPVPQPALENAGAIDERTATIASGSLDLYVCPDLSCDVLTRVHPGDTIRILCFVRSFTEVNPCCFHNRTRHTELT